MVRTVISLDETDKRWLDRQAALQHVPMTEVVRQAIQALRATREKNDENFMSLLDDTAGIWPHGDGLAWQQDRRDEWSR
jgi:hypothetical protein